MDDKNSYPSHLIWSVAQEGMKMSLFLEKSEKLVLVRLIKFAAPGLMQHILAVWCGAHPKVYVLLNHTIF